MTGVLSEPPLPPAAQARVLVPFLLVTVIWGSTWLVIAGQLGTVPPSWSVAYRFLMASGMMFAFAALTRTPLRLAGRDQLFVFTFGFALFVFNFNFVYRAEEHITSGLVAVVFALLVVPNAILARIFLGQGVSRRFLVGSSVALVGVALLFIQELEAAPANSGSVIWGIGVTLLGLVSASIANVMQGAERAKRLPMASLLAWGMLWGALIDAAYAWATSGPPQFEWNWRYVAGLIYLGLFASAIAFNLYFGIIRAIGPARAAYSSVLIPILAMALSTVFEGYVWGWKAAAGAALTMFGLVIALRARSPAR